MMPATNDLERCRQALSENGFDVFMAADAEHARRIFFAEVLPNIAVKVYSWGDSMTMLATGVLDELLTIPDLDVIRTFGPDLPRSEIIERRRQALLSDLFLTGSNAITVCGKLVNLDMIGNRTAAISFGPKKVVIFAGRNKIVSDLESAFARIRNIAAPRNIRRHDFDTPCATTGRCHDCRSPRRICNTWSILERCYPKGRIKIVLIDADLGL